MIQQSERITKARMGVILKAPFFGALLMRLTMIHDDSVGTFCTDGRNIRFNEAFAASLSDAQLRGVLAHEVAHCAQGHLWRMGARESRRWNVACDYAINLMLTEYLDETKSPVWELPPGGCLDSKYRGKSSEEIYHTLPPSPQPQGGMLVPGAGKPGEGASSPGEFTVPQDDGNSQESAELEREWKVAVTQAVMVAKMQGTCPASIARLVTELLEPRVPWRQVLREFIRLQSRDDFSWARPNRRYVGSGLVLPSLHSERMGRIIIGVDTSGSIGPRELSEFQAEIQAALDECTPEAIEVIYCDARVNGVEEFTPGDTVRLKPMGGGGTDFCPVFDHVEKGEEPVCLIYLTDGHGSFPRQEPGYPVLWATTDRDKYPFGQVVAIK